MKRTTSVLLTAGLTLALGASPAAATNAEKVCRDLDSGKVDTTGDPSTVTIAAPEGMVVTGYCLKAGSAKHGDGPVYVTLEEPQASVTVGHPSGKAVSHWSATYAVATPPVEPVVETKTSRWFMPDGGTPDNVTWPQPVYTDQCGGWVQVDVYPYTTDADKARTDALDDDGHLQYGEDHGWVLSWGFEPTPDCEVEEPPVDEPPVDEPPVEEPPVEEPPTEEPPVVEPPVVEPPVLTPPVTSTPVLPPAVVTPVVTPPKPEPVAPRAAPYVAPEPVLAETGFELIPAAAAALGLSLAGLGALVIAGRRRRNRG